MPVTVRAVFATHTLVGQAVLDTTRLDRVNKTGLKRFHGESRYCERVTGFTYPQEKKIHCTEHTTRRYGVSSLIIYIDKDQVDGTI